MTDMHDNTPVRMLVIGTTGRVGRMLRRVWDTTPDPRLVPVYQTRHPLPSQIGASIDTGTQTSTAPGATWVSWDPGGDIAPLLDHIANYGPYDAALCLAGAVPGQITQDHAPDNAQIARQVLAACDTAGIARVLMCSSSAVYGAAQSTPYAETDHLAPVNAYGHDKLRMEAVCAAASGIPPPAVTCLRIGNVAGADALLVNAAKPARLTLDRFADGKTPLRSYIGPQTLARVIAALIKDTRMLPKILNLALPDPVYMADLLDAAAVPYDLRPAPADGHQYITLNCTQLMDTVAGHVDLDAGDMSAAGMIAQVAAVKDPI